MTTSTFTLSETKNKYGIISFNIIERYTEDNKTYSEILYSYDNLNQAKSKLDLLIKLN
tara:strand:- start:483 stop:656 length:174 start_codon:yes stop_codon:yes gene_type:complete